MTPAAALASDPPEIRPRRIPARPRLAVAAAPAPSAETDAIVARPRLLEQLERAGQVTVVAAPAGSGKTSLLRSWVREAGLEPATAWLSLEQAKRDPQRFWLSVLDALRRTAPACALLGAVTAAPDFDGWAFVDGLLAALAPLGRRLWLIVDDLDELEASETLRQFEGLLARAPAELRFAVSTRRDLPLGLHRMRLDGSVTELRGADLRFSLDEARALFDAAGVDVPDSCLAALVERTEGWAAGLRLAAISLARHPDPERFVTEFSGSERTVAEYLLAEVLERQPAQVRELLLRTSVLERVNGSLADHLAGRSGSERILHELEDANAFVTSLDAGRSWFRYHRLFADFLRLELRRASPGLVPSLHQAAAEWLEQEGHDVEAIRHAQAARDWPRAARLLFDSRIGLILDGRLATLRELLDAFPAATAAADPELAATIASVRLREGSTDEAEEYLAIAERQARAIAADRRPLFALHLASIRLAAAGRRCDLSAAREAMQALDAALAAQPPGAVRQTEEIRALALAALGTAELWSLRAADARHHLEEGLELARRIGRPHLEAGCLTHLAILALLSGLSPSTALDFSEQAVALAEAHGLGSQPIVALALAAGAAACAWLGRFDEAEHLLERAEPAVEPDTYPAAELLLVHARGLLCAGQGRVEHALATFRDAERSHAMRGEHPLRLELRAWNVLALVRAATPAEARAALHSIPEQERDRGELRVAAAALHLAEGAPARAVDRLAPVTAHPAGPPAPGWAPLQGLLFEAAAHEQLGDAAAAEAALERALALAEPEGCILPFTIAPVRDLLERLPGHRTAHATLRSTILGVLAGASAGLPGEPDPLHEELSAAELRVVRFLPGNLRAPEIASELFVSANTVRTHIRHIYAKLDAHSRAEAVARARQLGLLAPSHHHRGASSAGRSLARAAAGV